jgi:hypothetical protein
MIFRTEINPRDHKGHYEMICHLQTECIRQHGAEFDTTKFAMGQLTPNSEICWFEGFVDDRDIELAKISEKKREFERRLAEATDFLKANGYEVREASKLKTFTGPVTKTPEGGWPPLDANTMEGKIFAGKAERIWRDADMIDFATIVFFRGPNEAKQLLEDYSNRPNKKP